MDIAQNISLKNFSTMRLGGSAEYITEIKTPNDLPEALDWAVKKNLPVIMVGGGSNIIWRDEGFKGLLLINRINGFEIIEEDENSVLIKVGSGENWDSVVERSVNLGWNGIEELSLIPGTAGATPIQNVGAYGREISEVLDNVEAYDSHAKKFVNLRPDQCQFSYRNSRFKGVDKGRFFITSITLQLTHKLFQPPYYSSLQKYFEDHQIKNINSRVMRSSVIEIRKSKLPDPATVANNGSFFTNPVISGDLLASLLVSSPDIIYWPTNENNRVKVSAAWLVDSVGFNNIKDDETGMATWPAHSLVLVNEHAKKTSDLIKFKQKIVDAVKTKFGITLKQEPELLP